MAASARWLIKRNCSASPGQLAWVFCSLVGLSFVVGVAFASRGLWMILPFVGLEVAAMALAYFMTARHAADLERIEIGDGALRVERREAQRCSAWSFPLAWVRIEVEETGRELGARVRVHAACGANRLELGRLLVTERRRVLARELKTALAQARAGVA
jgi:uncharacterized membrane protein